MAALELARRLTWLRLVGASTAVLAVNVERWSRGWILATPLEWLTRRTAAAGIRMEACYWLCGLNNQWKVFSWASKRSLPACRWLRLKVATLILLCLARTVGMPQTGLKLTWLGSSWEGHFSRIRMGSYPGLRSKFGQAWRGSLLSFLGWIGC